MSDPYVGEIRMFGFSFVPVGWLPCDGSLQSISENETLFALIGTIYGGDGVTTFGLPDLRGRVPLHQGQGPGLGVRVVGQMAGTETVTLLQNQLPAHTHGLGATTAAATSMSPANALPAAVSGDTFYVSTTTGNNAVPMAPQMLLPTGGTQPHENTMPTLAVQYCISAFGIFPQTN